MARKGTPLNAQSVKAATAEPGIRITLNDPSTPGLHLRVSGHTGEKTWTHRFYLGGKERKRRIGTYPAMSLADAHAEVERRRVMIRAGEDPDREHKERAAGDLSFGALAEMVLGAKAKTTRARTQELRRDAVDRYLVPAWGDRPANGITRADVIELCEAIRDRGHGITANRVRSTAHVIFAEGLYREFGGPRYLIGNPVSGTKPPLRVEPTRDRFLTREEIARLWVTLEGQGLLTEAIGKLTLLTGQRIGQILRMRWDGIDGAIWTTPAEHHKGGREIKTPLSTEAASVIAELRAKKLDEKWVFPSRAGSKFPHIANVSSKTLKRIRDEAGLAGWTWHDLRRTIRVWLVSATDHPRTPGLGIRSDVVDFGILTHKELTLGVSRYTPDSERPWQLFAEKRDALEQWDEFVQEAVEEEARQGAKVPAAVA